MPLSAGDKLGPYEILALIGKGGMGEVYRARDTRLGRDVAIKVSAAQFSERFEREAKAIAALNHPNICTLHDVGPNYLVMEFIEGESPKGPMPLDEALRIARQIADALEAAHEKGITQYRCPGSEVTVRMKKLVIMGTVQYCAETRTGWYATGMLINNVSGEPAADSRFESEPMPASTREPIAMPAPSKRDWQLAQAGHAKLLTSSITAGECKSHIEAHVSKAATERKKLAAEAWILKRFQNTPCFFRSPTRRLCRIV